MLVQLSVFSQTGTSDSNVVKLKKSTALSALQDLVRYDELKIRTDLLEKRGELLEKIISQKDGIIQEQRGTISRLELITSNQDAIKKEIDQQLKAYQKQIRKQKTLKWMAIVGGIVSTGTAIYFLK